MGTVDDRITAKRLWDDVEESLHDAMQYTLIKDIRGAIEKSEEAAADLKLLLAKQK